MGDPIDIIHHSYPTLSDYIEHMNRYSSLGAEMVVAKGRWQGPLQRRQHRLAPAWQRSSYNYFLRLGFLDGLEGLLLHLYHAVLMSRGSMPRRGSFRASNSDDLTDRSFLLRFRALPASARFPIIKTE